MELVTDVRKDWTTKSIRITKFNATLEPCGACGEVVDNEKMYNIDIVTQYGNRNSYNRPTYFCGSCFNVLRELINEME